jgi:RecB family exonuclease
MIGAIHEISRVEAIKAISTTSFLFARKCQLRAAWKQSAEEYTLPVTPSMRLGSVIHRLFEAAAKGRVRGPDAINALWSELLRDAEAHLAASWLDRHLVPLSSSIADFEVRRLRALRRAEELAEARHVSTGGAHPKDHLGLEVAVESTNGFVNGRIDRVEEDCAGVVLRDYKSGYVPTNDEGMPEAMQDQKDQLKLYAALFAEKFRIWPGKLEIVAVSGAIIPVSFSRSECISTLDEAQRCFARINAVADDGSLTAAEQQTALAKPSATGCRGCPYRAKCVAYLITVISRPNRRSWPPDVAGVLESQSTLGNGTISLHVKSGSVAIHVRGLEASASRHPALQQIKAGAPMSVFSLGRTQSSSTLNAQQLTTVYRMGGAQSAYIFARRDSKI